MNNQERLTEMQTRLASALAPTQLEIIDESHKHHGHVGSEAGAGHYALTIAAPIFNDKSLVECHRMVYAALGELMQKEIHALRIQVVK